MLSSGRQPAFCALGNQPTLELRNGSKDMEHQPARSGGCIDSLFQVDQIDLSAFEVLDGFQQFLEPKFSSWGKTELCQVLDVEPITLSGKFKNC